MNECVQIFEIFVIAKKNVLKKRNDRNIKNKKINVLMPIFFIFISFYNHSSKNYINKCFPNYFIYGLKVS